MRLSIFARLIISYFLLFSTLAGISVYFIYHLNQFNQITRSIITNDTSILEYSNQLSDALLSESRNDRKFIVLKDETLFENYQEARDEFNRLLSDALTQTSSEEIRQFFLAIDVQHQNLTGLVNTERELVKAAKPYSTGWYAAEKRKTADNIIEQIKKTRKTSEINVFNKIVNLRESGDTAIKISIIISFLALPGCLIIAFIITRSIQKPLDLVKTKTVDIAQGNLKGDLKILSPPVMAELATAINLMCRKLQEVDDMKSDFFADMSHELRTPLTSIKEGTTMLLEGLGGEISEKQQRILSIVVQESNRLIKLVNSLLDLSKMEAGMMKYQFEPAELSDLVKNTLDTLAPLAESKNISVDNKIGTSLPVKVDQARMLQVFRNIIGNAIKFTHEEGTIKIEAHVRGNAVEVEVHDNGIGIPSEEIERIFLKFQQVIPAKGERVKGTGFGLATVKQIILAHGGKVWATSQLGKGSTFYISLLLAA
jgi:two-component system sensor histidine kinase GlrK